MTKMIIANLIEKSKLWRQKLALEADPLFTALLVLLLGLGGLGLYELYSLESQKPAIVITSSPGQPAVIDKSTPAEPIANNNATAKEGKVLASKNGKKFYYPWCSGVSRIKEINRVYFASAAEAQVAGYTQAANCH